MSFALRQAFVSDIQDIMNVEADAFFTPIREKEEVFVERITVFPQGFFCFNRRRYEQSLRIFRFRTVGELCPYF